MAPAGQQAQHPLRIIGIHRLTQHLAIDYDDGVGGKDGPSIRLAGNRTSFIYRDAHWRMFCASSPARNALRRCGPDGPRRESPRLTGVLRGGVKPTQGLMGLPIGRILTRYAFPCRGKLSGIAQPHGFHLESGHRPSDQHPKRRANVALLMFAYSFLAMTSHNILKPVTKSKFIDQLGSDNLPYVLLASSVLIGMLMHLYASAARRVPRKYVIPITQTVLVALLVLFWALLRNGAVWVTVALYFFGQILGILLISQFWTLANDVYDARQAKRLFGLIGGGACLGGAVGAAITATRVEAIGSNNLLLVSAAALHRASSSS